MKRRDPIRIQLPPIGETWKEIASSSWHRTQYATWPPRARREENAVGALKMVRCILSLEEVFGAGLLEKFNASQGGTNENKPKET